MLQRTRLLHSNCERMSAGSSIKDQRAPVLFSSLMILVRVNFRTLLFNIENFPNYGIYLPETLRSFWL